MKIYLPILSISLSFLILSCQDIKEKTFEKASLEEDIEALTPKYYYKDIEDLKSYLKIVDSLNVNLSGKTYASIINEAKQFEENRLEKIRKEKELAEKRAKELRLRKIIEEKTNILCNKNWYMKAYSFLLKMPDNSLESYNKSKEVAEKSMIVKDAEVAYSTMERNGKYYLKSTWKGKLFDLMSHRGRRIKTYYKDSTYIIRSGKEVEKGTWEFLNEHKIIERRPKSSRSFTRSKNDIFRIDIEKLEEDNFQFIETEYNPVLSPTNVSNHIIFKTNK